MAPLAPSCLDTLPVLVLIDRSSKMIDLILLIARVMLIILLAVYGIFRIFVWTVVEEALSFLQQKNIRKIRFT